MKLSLVLSALSIIPYAAAGVAAAEANPPYDAEYNKYCSDGKTQGALTAGKKTFLPL